MKNIILSHKIKKELKEFQAFKKQYNFQFKQLQEKEGGSVFCGEICIQENADCKPVSEVENILNVGYNLHGPLSKMLSNLFPYDFVFKSFHLTSAESFFQGIKLKDKKAQRLAFKYSSLPSNHIKAASDFDWKESQTIYFQGRAYDRQNDEYDNLVDELYISLLQNKLYRNALKNVGTKYIMHSIGKTEKSETVFTRYEFEFMLNCLKDFLLQKEGD